MAEVYYYLPADKVEHVVECGIKLSRLYDRETVINGQTKKCISALLNPKDDMVKYQSEKLKCVKLNLPARYCFVADRYLYLSAQRHSHAMELFNSSIVPIQDYVFGSYRFPECLVATTVIYNQISKLNKKLDSPVLYDNSEKLYLNNIMESYREAFDDFYDNVLYFLFNELVEKGRFKKIEDHDTGITIFIDNKTDRIYTIKTADLTKY